MSGILGSGVRRLVGNVERLTDGDDVCNANKYLDEVLENLRRKPEIVSQFDPLKVPDYDGGKYKVWNGKVTGLSNLYRTGDAAVTYRKEVATVSGEITVKDVTIGMNYKAKAGFWINGEAHGKVSHLSVNLVFTAVGGKAELQSFKVSNLGDYKITRITGVSVVLNWLLKAIANVVLKSSRRQIIEALEIVASNALKDILSKVEVPF